MKNNELKIKACQFAICKLVNEGSLGFVSWDAEEKTFADIKWNDVLEWLDEVLNE